MPTALLPAATPPATARATIALTRAAAADTDPSAISSGDRADAARRSIAEMRTASARVERALMELRRAMAAMTVADELRRAHLAATNAARPIFAAVAA